MSIRKSKGCAGKETFQRMNFLYQAATLMAGKNNTLSCYYGNLLKTIAKKSVLRMEPCIKRTICKKCNIILKPGITAVLDLNDRNKNLFSIKCKKCDEVKNFLINKNYKLWLDDDKSIVEIYDTSNKINKKNEIIIKATDNGSEINTKDSSENIKIENQKHNLT